MFQSHSLLLACLLALNVKIMSGCHYLLLNSNLLLLFDIKLPQINTVKQYLYHNVRTGHLLMRKQMSKLCTFSINLVSSSAIRGVRLARDIGYFFISKLTSGILLVAGTFILYEQLYFPVQSKKSI